MCADGHRQDRGLHPARAAAYAAARRRAAGRRRRRRAGARSRNPGCVSRHGRGRSGRRRGDICRRDRRDAGRLLGPGPGPVPTAPPAPRRFGQASPRSASPPRDVQGQSGQSSHPDPGGNSYPGTRPPDRRGGTFLRPLHRSAHRRGVWRSRLRAADQEAAARASTCWSPLPAACSTCSQRRDIDLSRVQILVLDEADRMLDMGFWPDVRRILALLPEKRQNMLFSATLSNDVLRIAGPTLTDPIRVEVAPSATPVENITQALYPVAEVQKIDLLVRLLEEEKLDRVLVFTRTKHRADRVCRQLERSTHHGHGHPLQSHSGPAPAGARRLQGRHLPRAGRHRHRGPGHRCRQHLARHQLRPALPGPGLRASHRPHRPRGRRQARPSPSWRPNRPTSCARSR